MIWHNMTVRIDSIQYDSTRHDATQYDTIWFYLVIRSYLTWYDATQYKILCCPTGKHHLCLSGAEHINASHVEWEVKLFLSLCFKVIKMNTKPAEDTKATAPEFKQKEIRQFKSKAPKPGQKRWAGHFLPPHITTPTQQNISWKPLSYFFLVVLTASTAACQGWRALMVSESFTFCLNLLCVEMMLTFSYSACRLCSDLPLGGVCWCWAERPGSVWHRVDLTEKWSSRRFVVF